MTRLIDKKVVLEAVKALPAELDAETVQRCIEVLSNQPTVEAIPIKWLRNHMITHDEVVNGDYYADEAMELNLYVSDLIDKWYAETKDEYVTLRHEDIHFIDEDAERTFYESLAERKEE